MARSWWDLGEHSGYHGNELATYQITCAFCFDRGKFERVHHLEKENSSGKVLNYDTWKCEQCGNLTMILWSASLHGGRTGIHGYNTLPWPSKVTSFPTHWPAAIGKYWLQAVRSIEGENWDAAAVMARSALQLVMRDQKAVGTNLKQEIDDLATKGLLPPVMKDWSHEVRLIANESAHPSSESETAGDRDARDVVEFLGVLMTFTYDLPDRIGKLRARRAG
jgi:hypothetical protein